MNRDELAEWYAESAVRDPADFIPGDADSTPLMITDNPPF